MSDFLYTQFEHLKTKNKQFSFILPCNTYIRVKRVKRRGTLGKEGKEKSVVWKNRRKEETVKNKKLQEGRERGWPLLKGLAPSVGAF